MSSGACWRTRPAPPPAGRARWLWRRSANWPRKPASCWGKQAPAPGRFAPDWKDFEAHGVTPSLADLWLVARSVTPPGLARRFDTRFFATDASGIAYRVDGVIHPEAELVDLRWVTISETAQLNLHPITRVILGELESRIGAGLERDLPVPFFRPRRGAMVREEI